MKSDAGITPMENDLAALSAHLAGTTHQRVKLFNRQLAEQWSLREQIADALAVLMIALVRCPGLLFHRFSLWTATVTRALADALKPLSLIRNEGSNPQIPQHISAGLPRKSDLDGTNPPRIDPHQIRQ
ncbi:hypothetical protein [Castellaniella sp.]|uniref:hypothetical protein n=1 Tax=Castellaniella sp. TaxID=1955812 RepID=UPI0025C245EE|nr:hypothetical protein [Castellaniella sp.]